MANGQVIEITAHNQGITGGASLSTQPKLRQPRNVWFGLNNITIITHYHNYDTSKAGPGWKGNWEHELWNHDSEIRLLPFLTTSRFFCEHSGTSLQDAWNKIATPASPLIKVRSSSHDLNQCITAVVVYRPFMACCHWIKIWTSVVNHSNPYRPSRFATPSVTRKCFAHWLQMVDVD